MKQSQPKTKKQQKKKSFLIWNIVSILVAAYLAFFVVDYNAITDTIMGFSFHPSAEMEQSISSISLTSKGQRIMKASMPEYQQADDFNQNCPVEREDAAFLGCYSNRRIYVYDVNNTELEGIKEAVLAHELLHAVWEREKASTQNELEPLLRQVYQQHQDEMAEHMKTYSEENFVSELHSIIGTQLDLVTMPEKLSKHYLEIFENHSVIVDYYNQYNDKFVTLKTKIDRLGKEIKAAKEVIKRLRKKYRSDLNKLNQDIDNFNYRARNGYFSGDAEFSQQRSALIARQQQLNQDYNTLSNKIKEVNKAVEKYNDLIVKNKELYHSIDSNAAKPVEAAEK